MRRSPADELREKLARQVPLKTIGDPDEGWFADNPSLDPYFSANITLDTPETVEGSTYGVVGSSIVVLEEVR